jgi:hypothetical protein
MLFLQNNIGKQVTFTDIVLTKGQLYNLDNDTYFNFQFNPTDLEWEREHNWSNTNWIGDDTGGDSTYINSKPRTIDLSLMFVADPGVAPPEYSSPLQFQITDEFGLVDFQAIKGIVEDWEKIITSKGRPSRIAIIVGPNIFEGKILKSGFKISEFFPDLSPKVAILTLEFEEWIQTL